MPELFDALDQLREHDPARELAPISALDSEAIRERIVASGSTQPQVPAKTHRRKGFRNSSRRARIMVALAALLIGGGVATAAIRGQSTKQIVAAGLGCVWNQGSDSAWDVAQNGDSPTAACAPVTGVPASELVACASERGGGIVVYQKNGDRADQCKSHGLESLPANYHSTIIQVHALEKALTADYNKSDCVAPQQLAKEANGDLARLGFTGWRAVIDWGGAAGMDEMGHCGQFPLSGTSISDAAAAVATNGTVRIEIGEPRSILRLQMSTVWPIINGSGDRCYTLAGAQQMVRSVLDKAAGRTVPVKFAVTREQAGAVVADGLGSSRPQTRYDQGCTIVGGTGTAFDALWVQLLNKAGRPSP